MTARTKLASISQGLAPNISVGLFGSDGIFLANTLIFRIELELALKGKLTSPNPAKVKVGIGARESVLIDDMRGPESSKSLPKAFAKALCMQCSLLAINQRGEHTVLTRTSRCVRGRGNDSMQNKLNMVHRVFLCT